MAGLALAGLVLIAYVHHWSLPASALFLTMAWVGILAAGYFLWGAGAFVAGDGGSAGFFTHADRQGDLLAEKQSLLKAIKEVEFDHMMGKMSDADASSLSRLYRSRAVAILKELDAAEGTSDAGAETLSIADKIERDIRARAAVSGVAAKARQRAEAEKRRRGGASKKKKASAAAAKAEKSEDSTSEVAAEAEAEPEAEPEAKIEAKIEAEAEAEPEPEAEAPAPAEEKES
jgi:hypothetical protein